MDYLRSPFSPTNSMNSGKIFDEVKRSSMLILDDLGAHSSTAWAEEKLYQLIVHRYNSVLPTVITSRVLLSDPDQDDRESRASFSASIMSRLRDGLMVSERLLEAPDYRNRGSAKPPARRTRTERGRGRR